MTQAERPKNREVEDEMIRPPAKEGAPPRPATDPTGSAAKLSNEGLEPQKPAVKGTKSAPER